MLQYVLLLALLGAARVLYKIYFYQRDEKLKNFIKYSYRDLPLIGHLYRVIGRSVEGKLMRIISDLSDLNESTILWLFGKPIVVLNDPEDIRTFLNSPASLEKGSPFMAFYGTRMSLLAAHVSDWRPLRRSLNSAFGLNSMKYYMKSFNTSACKMISEIDENCNNGGFDVAQTVGRCATNAAFISHLHTELTDEELHNSQNLMENSLVLMGHRMMHYYYEVVLIALRKLLGVDYDLKKFDQWAVDNFETHTNKVLSGDLNIPDTNVDDSDYFLKRMSRMLQADVINAKNIMENITLFMISSSNTGSIAAAHALLLLAMNPAEQEELYQELKLALNPNDTDIDYDTITSKLPYLDRVIKETLRLLPGVPLLSRKADADIELSASRIIPANTDVIVPIFTLHRNHDKWGKDALRFNPDNFLSENMSDKHVCTYIPFAHGKRNCIAYKYATTLVKIMVAYAIRKYQFTTKLTMDELRYGFAITLKLNNGCMVSVTRRE